MIMRFFSVLIFILSFFSVPASAASADQVLKEMFVNQAATVNIWPAADIRVDAVSFNYDQPGSVAEPMSFVPIPSGLLPGPGRRSLALKIIRRGREVGRARLSGQVHLFGPVVQLVRTLPRNHLVSGRDIRIGRGDLSLYGPDAITLVTDACGKRLRRGRRAGSVLRVRDLVVPPVLKRGELVGIVADINGIRVRVPGVSRQDGRRGELVRVKNMMSRQLLMARVIDRDTVAAVY